MSRPAISIAFLLATLQVAAGGAAASETPAPPEPLEMLEAGDAEPSPWLPSCASNGRAGPLACRLEQRLVVQETGQPFLTLTIQVHRAGEQPVIAVQTPLGVYLPPGVALRIDDGEPTMFAITSCDTDGCHAGTRLAEPLLAALEAGRTLHLVLHTGEDQTLDFEIPLVGFTRAYAAIR